MIGRPLVEAIALMIRQEYAMPLPKVRPGAITTAEFAEIRKEFTASSPFDSANLRGQMYRRAFQEGSAPYKVYQSSHGKIIAVLDSEEQEAEIPWEMWWRLLRMFYRDKPYTIIFLAHKSLRQAPAPHHPIKPIHINGGYTYPCRASFVCIYRAEDATRVLIHELFHASCSDNKDDELDKMEAKTEAWAELVYAVVLAHGSVADSIINIQRQSDWMHIKNSAIRTQHMRHNGEDMHEFPWRYTIGKEDVWRAWGIYSPTTRRYSWNGSLRLTPLPSAIQKQGEDIVQWSTIL